MTRYRTVVADPPWPYDYHGRFVRPDVRYPHGGSAGSRERYGSASLEDLLALDVAAVLEDDAHLYLWTTNAFMVQAHELASAWGFEVKTICTWGKVHRGDRLRPSMKMGHWFRGATEHFLFGVRGSLRLSGGTTWPNLFLWPRLGQHSRKPEAFYDLVEQASPGPYLELFSRRHRLGWDVWGDQSADSARLEEELVHA